MRVCPVLVAAMGAVLSVAPALAEWPERPTEITMLIGNTPGGGSDVAARTFKPFLEKHLGPNATIIPVNRPGAGGDISFFEVSRAEPDGTTIGLNSMPNLVARVIEDPNTRYRLDDFTYLGNISSSAGSIVVPIESPLKTLPELIDYAKENPGQLKVAVGGIGNDDHLNVMRLAREYNLDIQIIPFGGGADSRNAVMGGHVDVGTMSGLEASGFQDRLRILAILAEERPYFAPDVPTAREQGIDIVGEATKGFIAPAGLPEEITQAYAAAIRAAVEDPEFVAIAEKQHLILDYLTPEEYEAQIRGEYDGLKALFELDPWK